MSDFGFNVWGTVASVLGTIALIPVLWAWLRTRVPTALLPEILALHKETQELLATAVRDGLLTNPAHLFPFNLNLLRATIRVEELQAEVYVIKSWHEDVAKWWRGLSGKMSMVRQELEEIRTKLAIQTSNERKALVAQGLYGKVSLPYAGDGHAPGTPSHAHLLLRDQATLTTSPTVCDALGTNADSNPSPLPASSFTQGADRTPGADGLGLLHMKPTNPSTTCSDGPPLDSDPRAGAGRCRDAAGVLPTHHLIPDEALQALLRAGMALDGRGQGHRSPDRSPQKPDKHRHGHGSAAAHSAGNVSSKKRYRKQSRFRALLHLVRYTYGVRLGAQGPSFVPGSQNVPMLDPESLAPQYVEDPGDVGVGDLDDWEDE